MDTQGEQVQDTSSFVYCLYASSKDADMRYLTRFVTSDPVPVLKSPEKDPVMIVPQMEAERAALESPAGVITRQQAGYLEIFETEKDPWRITAAMIHRVLPGPYHVPPAFPVALARALEQYHPVIVDDTGFTARRAVKDPQEIDWITKTQRAGEAAMGGAIDLIRKADIRNGRLWHDENPLTSERVRYTINRILLAHDCTAHDTIVSCGKETAMPHCTGSGQLSAHEPIVIDIFPCDNATGYYADMTRTVSRGEPSGKIRELYETVKEALLMAEGSVRAGKTGAELYTATKDYFRDMGYHSDTEGFTHSLGHGVGLQIHEQPALSPSGGELSDGNVITIEPGLYYRDIGGVRLENLGVVRKDGFELITSYPLELVV